MTALLDRGRSGPAALPIPGEWEELFRSWLTRMRADYYSESTIRTRIANVRRFVFDVGLSPDEVDEQVLVEWLASKRSWKRETMRAARSSLKSFFEHHHRNDLVAALPKIRVVTPNANPIPDELYFAALAAADPRTKLILHLAGDLGLRRAEISKIHYSDLRVDYLDYWLVVHGKGDKERTVPVNPQLSAMMLERFAANGNDWLFPSINGYTLNGHITDYRVGYLARLVLPKGWSLHSLRHRFATTVYAGSNDIMATSRLLGHSSVAVTQRYVASDRDKLRWVASLAAS